MQTEEYSGSRIMRRCAQLGITYDAVIESPYARQHEWQHGQFRIQYRDGENGTVGWGTETQNMTDRDTTPHTYREMLLLLGLPCQSAQSPMVHRRDTDAI
jgi:hypothetical protein